MRKIIVTATAIILAVLIPFRAFAASTTSFSMAPVKVPELKQGIMLYYSGADYLTSNIVHYPSGVTYTMYEYISPAAVTGTTGARLLIGLDIPDSVAATSYLSFYVNAGVLSVNTGHSQYVTPQTMQVQLFEPGWSAMDYINNDAKVVGRYSATGLANATDRGYYIEFAIPSGTYNQLGGYAVLDIFWFVDNGIFDTDPNMKYFGFFFSKQGTLSSLSSDTDYVVDAIDQATDKITSAIDQATDTVVSAVDGAADEVTSAIDGAVNEDFGYSKPDTGVTDDALSQGNDILGQMQSSMDGFGDQIKQATNDLTSQMEPISDVVSGVWDMLPAPIIAATGGVVVFLVVRKVVGR